jgi:Uma2 family endonuclease
MKDYLTIIGQGGTETRVAEPVNPLGFTYADYLEWNFKERIGLIRGKIFKMSPAPGIMHQKILSNIFGEFYVFLKTKPGKVFSAPAEVRLRGKPYRRKNLKNDEITTVVQPDIMVVCDEEKLKYPRVSMAHPDWWLKY